MIRRDPNPRPAHGGYPGRVKRDRFDNPDRDGTYPSRVPILNFGDRGWMLRRASR